MSQTVTRKYQGSSFRKYFSLLLMVVFGYLLEACVMPYVSIFGVVPNLLYVIIGVVTVAYGKLRALWVGLAFGLLMQIMLPSVSVLNLAIYPVTTLFCSFPFADKPLKRLEYERATNKAVKELSPRVRTVLCTALNILFYEVINVTYVFIRGSALTPGHFLKALLDILLTTLLCLVLQFPLRRLILGRSTETLVLKNAPVVFRKS